MAPMKAEDLAVAAALLCDRLSGANGGGWEALLG